MREKYRRFYGGWLAAQERWLNRMAASGHRLVQTGKLTYEFEDCAPGQYQYKVEFIGHKSGENARDYAAFLEDCGYRVFFKNIRLNYSVGKAELRPWAEKGGRIATSATTINRELLIVEKENDGKPFELHTTYEDRANYYRQLGKPWLFTFAVVLILGIVLRSWILLYLAALCLGLLAMLRAETARLNKHGQMEEWKETDGKKPLPRAARFLILAAILAGGVLASASDFSSEHMGIYMMNSGVRLGYVESKRSGSWSARYTLLDGTMRRRLRAGDGVLRIAVETESGSLSIEMTDDDGTVVFSEDNIGTETFRVEASGQVTVFVRAEKHKGSFSIEEDPS